jgi:hypothetical protein
VALVPSIFIYPPPLLAPKNAVPSFNKPKVLTPFEYPYNPIYFYPLSLPITTPVKRLELSFSPAPTWGAKT